MLMDLTANPDTMFEYVESVSMEGPLEKKGKFKTWSWSKYWFVLDEDQLCYYKDSKVNISLVMTVGIYLSIVGY